MIDIHKEKLISVSQAAHMIPPTLQGRATHTSTLFCWIHRGSRGRRLEAVRIGGCWFTTIEALARFAEHPPTSEDATTTSSRFSQLRARRATEALERLGL